MWSWLPPGMSTREEGHWGWDLRSEWQSVLQRFEGMVQFGGTGRARGRRRERICPNLGPEGRVGSQPCAWGRDKGRTLVPPWRGSYCRGGCQGVWQLICVLEQQLLRFAGRDRKVAAMETRWVRSQRGWCCALGRGQRGRAWDTGWRCDAKELVMDRDLWGREVEEKEKSRVIYRFLAVEDCGVLCWDQDAGEGVQGAG